MSAARRVLVTGASGFIGRHALAPLVARGYAVHAVARGPIPDVHGVQAHRCDLLDPSACRALVEHVRPVELLHFAWYAVPGKFWTAPENMDWLSASLHLVRSFAAAGGRRVVVAGTCAEYDWSHETLSEADTPLAPATPYGAAKQSLRLALEQAAPALGIDWAWGRIFWAYGPHEPAGRLVSDVIAGLLAGRRVPVSAGTQQRDLLHVEDVASAFASLLDSGYVGAINIGSGEPIAIRTVVEIVGELVGRSDLIDFGALPMRANEPPRLVADVSRLRDVTGFIPRYDLRSGLAHTVAWWQKALA